MGIEGYGRYLVPLGGSGWARRSETPLAEVAIAA